MKEGWKYVKLGEVASFMSGYTPSKGELLPNGKIPYFKVSDMNTIGNEVFLSKTELYVNSPKKIYPKDAIVFPKNGGAIYTHKLRFLSRDSVVDLNTEAVNVKEEICLKEYLMSFFSFLDLSIFDNGGGLPSINIKKMASFTIPLPPLAEQEAIVARLDSSFAKIDAIKAKAEKSLDEAKALFQSALTEMMKPKEGWKEKKLGEVAKYRKEHTQNTDLLYVGMEHIESGTGRLIGTIPSKDVLSSNFKFYKGDVLYGRLRPYLKKVLIADFDGCCSTEIFPIHSTLVIPSFLKYWLLLDEVTEKINATCAGCRMPRGNMNKVLDFNFPLPPLSEQESIVSRLDAMSEKVKALEANYKKTVDECDALKQAILRDIFEQ